MARWARWIALAVVVFVMVFHASALQAQSSSPQVLATQASSGLSSAPVPTLANVQYGSHRKQVLDFYRADSNEPTPVVIYIHGGGFTGGSKFPVKVQPFLAAGISVVSVEYRFLQDAVEVQPPIRASLGDCARAVQFVRSKAREWNIDKTRVAAWGGSAGALTSLWLAFHDDMADAASADPVARESTRLLCAAGQGAQTTLDPALITKWIPNLMQAPNVFGIKNADEGRPVTMAYFLSQREKYQTWIQEYSPLSHLTRDDPPVMVLYNGQPAMGQDQRDPLHNPNWGVPLAEKCRELGVECQLVYDGLGDVKFRSLESFLIAKLKKQN